MDSPIFDDWTLQNEKHSEGERAIFSPPPLIE